MGWTAYLGLLLGVYALRHRRQLQLKLRLRRHGEDEALHRGIMLVAQEEGDLALTTLVLSLQAHLWHFEWL